MGTGRGGMRCIKILLCIFNLTFWLAGLAVIAFGLWLRFGGVMADFASEKKSPEYFFMGSCKSRWCLHTGRIAANTELLRILLTAYVGGPSACFSEQPSSCIWFWSARPCSGQSPAPQPQHFCFSRNSHLQQGS